MVYPKIEISVEKYRHNVKKTKTMLADKSINMMAVTKVFCAVKPLVDVLNEESIQYLADSRLENLKKIDTNALKVLLRLPSLSSVEETVKHADISLNSEWTTINKLNETAKRLEKIHKIILMIDVGDLREGVFYKENVSDLVKNIEQLNNIELYGLGTNVTCYGGVLPTSETTQKLVQLVKDVEKKIERKLTIISGGNSSHLAFLESTPSSINNLRIGEALVLGRETSYGKILEGLHEDVFILKAEIIELKEKPTYPEGEIGMNAFGKTPEFEDKGNRRRAIISLGKQDVDYTELIPKDRSISILGSSSDHIILDVTNSEFSYKVGDVLTFNLTYGSILSLMTSPYVEKDYV